MLQMPDGDRRMLIRGLARFRVLQWTHETPHLRARVEAIPEPTDSDETTPARRQALLDLFRRIVETAPHLPEEAYVQAINIEDAASLADMIASTLDLEMSERQQVLEALEAGARLKLVTTFATRELEQLELTARVQEDARQEMSKAQREYFLRQQLKAIQEELGEAGEERPDLVELRERLEGAKLTEGAREVAERELDRLENMNPAAAEYTVARTYLEWLLELPWLEGTHEIVDVKNAQQVLDTDHFDLEDVK